MVHTRSLSGVLGGSRELALFEAFALRKNKALSAKDVERFTGVSWATVHRRLDDWVKSGVLDAAGKDGKAILYRLNTRSPSVRALAKAVTTAVVEMFESDLIEEGVEEAQLELPAAVHLVTHRTAVQNLFIGAYGRGHIIQPAKRPQQRIRATTSWHVDMAFDIPSRLAAAP